MFQLLLVYIAVLQSLQYCLSRLMVFFPYKNSWKNCFHVVQNSKIGLTVHPSSLIRLFFRHMYISTSTRVYCSAIVVIVLFIAFNGIFPLQKFLENFFHVVQNSKIGLTVHPSSLIRLFCRHMYARVYCSAIVVIVLFIAFNGIFPLQKFLEKIFSILYGTLRSV